jgi:hypothetical protein
MFKPKMFTKHCPESLEESDNTEGYFAEETIILE